MKTRDFIVGGLIVAALGSCIWLIRSQQEGFQEDRQRYCQRILVPETCQVLVERGAYNSTTPCVQAMAVDGVCNTPIKSTLGEMQRCVLQLRNTDEDEGLPESCARLRH